MEKAPQNKRIDRSVSMERLRSLIIDSGWSQQSIAEAVGCTQMAVSSWVVGRRTPSVKYMVAFARLFDVSIDYLIGLTNKKKGD